VIAYVALQTQSAEPTIGEVEMYLVAQPPLGLDAHAVTDEQHPDH
jgi:hypothetical protein